MTEPKEGGPSYWKDYWSDISRLWPWHERPVTAVREAPPTFPTKFPPSDHLAVLYQQVAASYTAESEHFERIERKATTVLATTGVLGGLAVGAVDKLAKGLVATTLAIAALTVLLYAILCGTMVIWPETTKGMADAEWLLQEGYNPPTNRFLARSIRAAVNAVQVNRRSGLAVRRGRWLRRQLRALLLGALFLLLALVASYAPALGGAAPTTAATPSAAQSARPNSSNATPNGSSPGHAASPIRSSP